MQGLMEFHGHEVVQLLVGKGELCRPLEDYFTDRRLWGSKDPDFEKIVDTNNMIEAWFDLDEQGRKECIRRRGKECCFVTGDSSREVHEFRTRGAHASAALAPWNMAVVSPKIHDLLQRKVMKIIRFDPLDTRKLNAYHNEGCLIMYGIDGHLMREEDLWIYQAPKRERAEEDLEALKNDTLAMRSLGWGIARRLKRLKESGGYAEDGSEDIYMCASQHGYPSSEVKEMIRAAGFAEKFDVNKWMELLGIKEVEGDSRLDFNDDTLLDFVLAKFLSTEVAARLKKVSEEDLAEVMSWFAELPPAEVWDRYNEKFPPKEGRRKFRIMKRQPYREVHARSIDELDEKGKRVVEYGPEDMVEAGGTVVIGIKGARGRI